MTMTRTPRARITAAVLVAVMAGGCSATLDRSGGATPPTTLTLASNDGSDTHGGLERFVALVDELSRGRVHVEVSAAWREKGEHSVLQDVAGGKAALGWSGTRSFDTIGVDTFRPLHAPFLVGSYPAQRAVVSAMGQDLLDGLHGSGMTGLAVLADELRFPAGADGPLLSPEDFQDLTFGVMPSNEQSAAVTALGARPRAISVPNLPGVGGLETMWWTYARAGQQRIVPFVTPNAVLWPRTTVLVGNTAALEGLDSADRQALTKAAAEASRWSLDHAADDVAGEMAFACRAGARIATASAEQLAALRRAVEPAYQALRSTPEQAEILARIEQLVDTAPAAKPVAVPTGCAYTKGDETRPAGGVLPEPLTGPGRTGDLPSGTYRYSLTEKQIRDGVDMSDDSVRANAGVWTWTLGDGRWSYLLKPNSQDVPEGFSGNSCEGYYDVHGDQIDFTTVTVYPGGECAPPTWKAQWRAAGRDLVLDVTTDGDDLDFLFGSEPWQRI